MSNQVQCPNCGGYRVNLRGTDSIDIKSGEKISNGWPAIILGMLFLLCLPLAWISRDGGLTGSLVILVVVIVLIVAGVRQQQEFVKADNIKTYKYACYLCGYEWNIRTDEPLPIATVRPDLIAKGAQKLEEERLEEERRRRQDS